MTVLLRDLYREHAEDLGIELVTCDAGLSRRLRVPEAHRPGLSLSGYLKGHAPKRLLVFGKVEVAYLRDLSPGLRRERLDPILTEETPAVIVARRCRPPRELVALCEERGIPLFRSHLKTMDLIARLSLVLSEAFAPRLTRHGTLVEVFGVGVMIQGESSVGKSEAALGLIERGHRLISDDAVKVRLHQGRLEGSGAELTKHHMEIRGIGIINIANLYGAVCVRNSKDIDLIVNLEAWDDNTFYDRAGLEENTQDILGVSIPAHVLPVKPGRDVVLLIETLALNHRLKGMGYHSARDFNAKLLSTIQKNGRRHRAVRDVEALT